MFFEKQLHKSRLKEVYRDWDLPNIEVLAIPDEYEYMEEALVELLQAGVDACLPMYD